MSQLALSQSIAASVDVPVALVPLLGALFRGIGSLGSEPGVVVRLLEGAGVGEGDRVIDVACGKGTFAVAAARAIGCCVVGVDGAEAFVAEGRELARRRGVEERVSLMVADVERLPRTVMRRRFDAAVMVGLRPVEEAAALLRRLTRPGGVYVIDDCYWDPERGDVPRGLARPPTLAGHGESIAALGDVVECVHVPTPSRIRRRNDRLCARLQRNAREIEGARPRLGPALRAFLRRQRAANGVLTGAVRPGVWVVRRGR